MNARQEAEIERIDLLPGSHEVPDFESLETLLSASQSKLPRELIMLVSGGRYSLGRKVLICGSAGPGDKSGIVLLRNCRVYVENPCGFYEFGGSIYDFMPPSTPVSFRNLTLPLGGYSDEDDSQVHFIITPDSFNARRIYI
ncbi:hypothetical protein JW930_04325 [Candidatus Woesearchaeota archaeon]|nr:hypothetical protein [Candidatus Woesearchaeota archaeon]